MVCLLSNIAPLYIKPGKCKKLHGFRNKVLTFTQDALGPKCFRIPGLEKCGAQII